MAVLRWALLWLAPTLLALRLRDERDHAVSTPAPHVPRAAASRPHGLVLLTTAVIREERSLLTARSREILAAIGENLAHTDIVGAHLLFEGTRNNTCADVPGLLSLVAPDVDTAKLRCVDSPAEPMYKDLLDYANRELAGNVVALVNADTVFDESLHSMMDGIAAKPKGVFYVLSAVPPAPNGAYSRRTGAACGAPHFESGGADLGMANAPRCVLGEWDGGGWGQRFAGDSWDGYIFTSPLPAGVNTSRLTNVRPHILGAENRVAYELVMNGNMEVYNPCKHIRLQHWHCAGGKAHGNFSHDVLLLPRIHRALFNVFPCWDCPGLTTNKRESLCERGTKQSLTDSQRRLFKHADLVEICCADAAGGCSELDLHTVPLCKSPTQTNCVVWEGDNHPVIH